MGKINKEEFKVYKNVFDNFTNRCLFKLESKEIIKDKDDLFPISVGKESNVFISHDCNDNPIIVKIYRLQSCDFNKMYTYLKHDPKYMAVQKQKRAIIFNWVRREYRNLIKAKEIGIKVPTIFAIQDHILVMELIGDHEVAKQLKDAIPKDLETFKAKILEYVEIMKKNNMVHGDLSDFNILNYNEEPVFIDYSQASPYNNFFGKELYTRDTNNIERLFKKFEKKK